MDASQPPHTSGKAAASQPPRSSPHQEDWMVDDPLHTRDAGPGAVVAAVLAGLLATLAIYAVLGVALLTLAPLLNVEVSSPQDDAVFLEVAALEEPEAELPPVPEPEPEPEPELPPEPEPELPPEPEPEPPKEKPPEPEPPREKPPEPEPPREKPPEPELEPPRPAAAMDPVELEGLTMESTVTTGDFAIKQGKGIEEGRISSTYVDPRRFDQIKVAKGSKGDGSGSAIGTGTAATDRPPVRAAAECKEKKAKATKQVKVPASKYPAEAKRRGIEGVVIAVLSVNAEGRVVDVQVSKGAGYGFDELAVEAFKQWVFEPAEKSCKPVATKVRFNYAFSLDVY